MRRWNPIRTRVLFNPDLDQIINHRGVGGYFLLPVHCHCPYRCLSRTMIVRMKRRSVYGGANGVSTGADV
jgi:hypothetical protein